jgi:hypothetical protein
MINKKSIIFLNVLTICIGLLVIVSDAYAQEKPITVDEKIIYKFINNYLIKNMRPPTRVCKFFLSQDFIFGDTLLQNKIRKYFTEEDIVDMKQQYKAMNLKTWSADSINAKLFKKINRRNCSSKKKSGCYFFSLPLFSTDKSKALLYVYYLDRFNSMQTLEYFEKKDDSWVFQTLINHKGITTH